MADWASTIVGLWDLAVRVATFANDIRSAQDDFVGLRAEAECLLICINSLNSPSCRDALYRYISSDQAADLDTLVKNTDLNMRDLNKFIAKCWRLVERRMGRDGLRRRGWKGLAVSIKASVAKVWARYWFAMADKQAFRDKLVLPAQSVNIYLTSLTHIGLVNVGFLMQMSGHGTSGGHGCNCVCGSGGGGGGGHGRGGGRGGSGGGPGSGTGGNGPIVINPLHDWRVVGRRLAFKDAIARRSDLTADLEEEIITYALHLMRGGQPFDAGSAGGSGNAGGKSKVTKTTKTTTTRVRSRSRSGGALGLGVTKGKTSSKMYMVRKKSSSKPATERVEIVDRLMSSESDDDILPPRRLLALPAPDSASSTSGPRVIEIKPPRGYPGSSPSDGSESGGPRRGPRRSPSPTPPPSPSPFLASGGLHPDDDRLRERLTQSRPVSPQRHQTRRRTRTSATASGFSMSPAALRERRRLVLRRIQDEADDAAAELEAKQAASRDDRRRYRHESRHTSLGVQKLTPEQEREEDKEDDILEMCSIIEQEYGVRVVQLPEGARDPILAPKVKPAAPVPDEEEIQSEEDVYIRKSEQEKTEKMKYSTSEARTRTRSRLVASSENETSEAEDEELVKSMSRSRSDRLKAETSLLGSTAAGYSHGPRTYGYDDPYVRRSRSFNPEPYGATRSMRFEPYPTRPYDRHREQERRRSDYPTQIFQDDIDFVRPRAERVRVINPEPPRPYLGRRQQAYQPNIVDDSEDDSLYGSGRPAPRPKGPGPGPAPPAPPAPPGPSHGATYRNREHDDEIIIEREVPRGRLRRDDSGSESETYPEARPRLYQRQTAPGDIPHHDIVIRRYGSDSDDDRQREVLRS